MDRTELRARQRPLKERYGQEPEAALITLHAQGRLGDEAVSCSVDTGRAVVAAGLHPATGGDGTFACSGDMLLQALVACAGVTLRSVATNRGLAIGGTVRAEGDLDFRGTLGVDRSAPVGFRSIRLVFDLETTAGEDEIAELVATTERYCVVLQTLVAGPPVTVAVEAH
ncbi:MAG TPA: OsmC family protein [Acidimicrobiales bacterium]|nr:OsmC family protein [Acidimicrobiales bacterium]